MPTATVAWPLHSCPRDDRTSVHHGREFIAPSSRTSVDWTAATRASENVLTAYVYGRDIVVSCGTTTKGSSATGFERVGAVVLTPTGVCQPHHRLHDERQ